MSGPLPAALLPLTLPASWLYRLGAAARNRRFDAGVGIVQLPLPVISIGNLTTGGTGKTPMVATICDLLRSMGRHPVIAMRGYAARDGQPSDEEAEYAERLPSVPVVAAADRVEALKSVLPLLTPRPNGTSDWPEIDCIILDDGFQHRRIARDLDIVLIDASADTFSDRLLPAGHLREPAFNLKRADAVIVTHAKEVDSRLANVIERHHGKPPLAWTRHAWRGLRLMTTAGCSNVSVDWLKGKFVVALLGVGNPSPIRSQVLEAGVSRLVNLPVRDHQVYDRDLVDRVIALCKGKDALITTAKDWVKLGALLDLSQSPAPVVVPELAIEFVAGEAALRARIEGEIPSTAAKPAR